MRLITVKGPKGSSKKIVELAFAADIKEVSIGEQHFSKTKK